MNKCIGCGATLQDKYTEQVGYTKSLDNKLCERCFRINNYNDYKLINKDSSSFIDILKNINKTNDLVILVIDLFNISKNISEIKKYINNDVLLVLTKRDIIPKSCYDEKIKEYFNDFNLNIKEKIIISTLKNYNLDLLYEKINQYKKSKNVYVIGFTNAGKSTLINKIIYNYSSNKCNITTSNLPTTTIDTINIKVNDELTIIDTPGLIDDGDIINYIDIKDLNKIIPKKEIKPINYQIKVLATILIDNFAKLSFIEKNNITIYASNNLNIKRLYKSNNTLENLKKYILNVDEDTDIVIQGLCFINVKYKSSITIYTKENVSVYTRKHLI